ncbi:MAG TPA: DUF4157 domain-containing protein [Kofleriaceae bacterium]|nr:DUF4157 domain-containing protein [Kofleriaceae bacterium]
MPDGLSPELSPSELAAPAEPLATPSTGAGAAEPTSAGARDAAAPRVQALVTPSGVGLARKQAPGAPAADPESPAAISAQLGGGQPLSGPGAGVASAFDDSFSDVRIHTDRNAARLASQMGARAFTIGSNVAFASGQYAPGSLEGDALLAHELTHVLQQRGTPVATQRSAIDEPSSTHEEDADRGAASALSRLYHGGGAAIRSAGAVLKTRTSLQRCKGSPKTAEFAPALGTKTTSLKGTFGDYTVKHGLTQHFDATKMPPYGAYNARITMKPNAKTGGHDVAFIQTWRQKDVATGARVTAANPSNVSADEAKRIDPKTGMAVDRADPAGDKTPFFGMTKSGDGLTEFSTAHKGKSGGDDAFLDDTPGFNDPYEIEFTTTATDMTDGTPYDAIGWGFKYDGANKVYTEITPYLVAAGSEQMAARDRAYKKWNDSIATAASGIDPIAIPFDPVTAAGTVQAGLTGVAVDAVKVRTTLLAVTDADKQARVRACYEVETGRKLKDDLTSKLSADEQKGLEVWTK